MLKVYFHLLLFGVPAVSYTHLDVYKRQIINIKHKTNKYQSKYISIQNVTQFLKYKKLETLEKQIYIPHVFTGTPILSTKSQQEPTRTQMPHKTQTSQTWLTMTMRILLDALHMFQVRENRFI